MSIITIKEGDDRWMLFDGPVVSPRASLEISNECPREISKVIQHAILEGYLKPVAYVRRKELTWEALL